MRRPTIRRSVLLVCAALALTACEKSKDKKKDESTTEAQEPAAAAGIVGITSLDQAGLSSGLAPSVPVAVEGAGPGITPAQAGTIGTALKDGKRSYEACKARNLVRASRNILNVPARALCHLEAAAARIKFGKEYSIDSPEIGKFSFWVDDGKKDQLIVYLCAAGGNYRQKITVTGAITGRAKGTFTTEYTEGDDIYEAAGRFDNGFTRKNRQRLAVEAYVNDTKAQQEVLLQSVLNLNDKSVSLIAGSVSAEGMVGEGDAKGPGWAYDSVAAKIGQNFGQAFVYQAIEHEGADVPSAEISSVGTFDNAGQVLVKNDVKFFRDGEALDVDADDMPKPLPDSFRVPEIDYGWDCAAEEEFKLDGAAAALAGCDETFKDQEEEDCEKDVYARGDTEVVTQDKLAPSEDESFDYEGAADEAGASSADLAP